jgi:hypothetical protein
MTPESKDDMRGEVRTHYGEIACECRVHIVGGALPSLRCSDRL